MTTTIKSIIPRKACEAASTKQYTAINVVTQILTFTATNTSANAITISVYLPSGSDAPSAANQVIKDQSIAANECATLYGLLAQAINPSGTIYTQASAAGLTISASGAEMT
jgi:hypothetical protein